MKETKKRPSPALDGPERNGPHTLHPLTFGLMEWLQEKRKNPLLLGQSFELRDVIELCMAFTVPSVELAAMNDKEVAAAVERFSHGLTPADFKRIQKHAETQLGKFRDTAVQPKKRAPRRTTGPRK